MFCPCIFIALYMDFVISANNDHLSYENGNIYMSCIARCPNTDRDNVIKSTWEYAMKNSCWSVYGNPGSWRSSPAASVIHVWNKGDVSWN